MDEHVVESPFIRIAKKIWPKLQPVIKGIIYFILTVIKGIIKVVIQQLKGGFKG